ncbi:MAG: hypothetical protein JXR94_03960 [Candidatus Hydrogenedentes bacterium]|nr:hypothetical protein [Candidatus Hydrogenedentota bacterium]
MTGRVYYEELQRFPTFAYVVSVGTAAVAAGSIWAVGGRLAAAPVLILILAFTLNLLFLKVRVTDKALHVRIGLAAPLLWKSYPTNEIRVHRAVEYRPILDAGGWGMRFGRFEARACRFWNARGNRGVLIETPKHRYIIGSQTPERLADALRQAGAPSDA